VILGLELETSPVLFLWRVFWDRILWAICLGWLRTEILLISASWVVRITGWSHRHPTIVGSEFIYCLHLCPLVFLNTDERKKI
jgi:hypothetical protein